MLPSQLRELIGPGTERRSLEFKRSCSPEDGPALTGIVRACLAMANTQDGGVVVVGVDQTGRVDGLGPHRGQWSNVEAVQEKIGAFAEPWMSLRLSIMTWEPSVDVAVLEVDQFESTPVFCKKTGHQAGKLRQGALYVRSRDKIASVEPTSSEDMRALLDLALVRRLQEYLRTGSKAGIDWETHALADSVARFDAELERFRNGK